MVTFRLSLFAVFQPKNGVSRGAGVEMDGTPSTQMVGTSHPLGCGSTQIGGGVDGMMMGIGGLGQTLSLLGLC